MPLFENHAGVSVSLDKIRLVELVYKNNEFLLESVDEENFDESLAVDLSTKTLVNVLQNSFNNIVKRNHFTSRNISFSLDPDFFEVFEVPFDNTLLKADLTEQFRWDLKKLKPMLVPDDYLIQSIELQKLQENSNHSAVVLALNKSIITTLMNLTEVHQLKLKYVDYAHTASDNVLRFMDSIQGMTGLSIYNSGSYFSSIILDNFSPATILKNKKAENDTLFSNLKEKLQSLFNQRPALKGSIFSFVTGKQLLQSELEKLNSELELNFEVLNPFSLLKRSENFSSSIDLTENPTEYSSATGIALRLF